MRLSALLPLLPFLLSYTYPTASASPLPRSCSRTGNTTDPTIQSSATIITDYPQSNSDPNSNSNSTSTSHPSLLNLDLNLGHLGLDILNPTYDINSYGPNPTPGLDLPFHLLGIRSRPLRRHLEISHGVLGVVGHAGPGENGGWKRQSEEEESPNPDESMSPPDVPQTETMSMTSTATPDTPTPTATDPSEPTPTSTPTAPEAPEASTNPPSTPTADTPTASTEPPSTPTADTPTASTEAPSTPTADTPTASTEPPSTPTAPSAPDQPHPERQQKQRIPVFSESAAELIQAELQYVRNKYANAMKMLYGAPMTLASVDVVVGGGAEGVEGEGGEGGEVGARVSVVPEIILEPTPSVSETEKVEATTLASGAELETVPIATTTVVSVPDAQETVGKADMGSGLGLGMASGVVDGAGGAIETGLVEAGASGVEAAQVAWSSRRRSNRKAHPQPNRRKSQGRNPRRRANGPARVKRKTNSPAVPLIDYIQGSMDVLYYGEIGVGTPEQTLTVDFDTGSADLWIPAQCKSCKSSQFNSPKSRTYRDTGKAFSVEYGSGSVSGRLAQDVVSLGNTVVKNQYFGAVNEESEDFTDSPHSGVMGMAFSSISSSGQKTYFENLMEQGSVKVPIFSFHLARHQEHGSQLCVGCYDSSKFTGSFTWLPLVSKTYWSISMTGFSAKGPSMNALSQTLIGAIDTGTTLIYVPPRIATQFYSQIPGSEPASQYGEGFFQYPCKADTSIKLRLGLNNKGFDWNVADFNLGRTAKGSSMCVGAILGVNDGFPDDLAIIGDVFLKSWYSVYDQSSRARVGFASSSNNAKA